MQVEIGHRLELAEIADGGQRVMRQIGEKQRGLDLQVELAGKLVVRQVKVLKIS